MIEIREVLGVRGAGAHPSYQWHCTNCGMASTFRAFERHAIAGAEEHSRRCRSRRALDGGLVATGHGTRGLFTIDDDGTMTPSS